MRNLTQTNDPKKKPEKGTPTPAPVKEQTEDIRVATYYCQIDEDTQREADLFRKPNGHYELVDGFGAGVIAVFKNGAPTIPNILAKMEDFG